MQKTQAGQSCPFGPRTIPAGTSSSPLAESPPDLLERSTGWLDELPPLLLLLLTFELFADVIGDVDEADDDVDDADDSGGDVVVVGIRVVANGDLVRAILAGGGTATAEPKIEAEKSSFGPKFGFRMLSMEKGSARRAANWLLLLPPLPIGDVIGLGRSGCVNMG